MTTKKTGYNSAAPVFRVGDIAATLHWYATHLGFDVQGVPESPPHAFGCRSCRT